MSERSEAKSCKHAKTILPLIRFSTQCETSLRNGAATGRFRKASVRHAPRRRGYIAHRDEQQPPGRATINRPRTTNRPVKDKRTGCCQNRMSAVPFTLLVRMTCMVGPTGNVILEPGNYNVSNLF